MLYELTARDLYTYYKADGRGYAMVMQNINRELCRRLRRADDRIADLTDASRATMRARRAGVAAGDGAGAGGADVSDAELRSLQRSQPALLFHVASSVLALLLILDMIWKPGA